MMGWEDGRQLAPTPGEEESVRGLLSPWLSLRNAFLMLPDSGRFLCLQSQTERASDQGALAPRSYTVSEGQRPTPDCWREAHGTSFHVFFLLFSPYICSPATPNLGRGKMDTYLVVVGFEF